MAKKAEVDILKLRDAISDRFGADSAMMGSDMPVRAAISSGSLALDFAIGPIGGLPPDRLIEVFGAESCGKTTLGLMAMSNFLDAYPKRCALFLDTEHKLDKGWLETLVGAERLANRIIYLQPDDVEEAMEMYKQGLKSGLVCFTLFDSIAASVPRKGVETEKNEMTGNAKPMALFAPIMSSFSAKYECCTFAINQVRQDIAGYHRVMTPGGQAPKHMAALRIYLKKGKGEVLEDIDGDKVRIGYVVAAKIIKNQVGGIEGRVCQYWFFNVPTEKHGFGVDQIDEITRLAILTRVIERKGGWYYHPSLPDGGKILGQDQFAAFVKQNAEIRQELTATIMARLKDHAAEVAPVSDPEKEDDMPVGQLFRQDSFGDT